MNSRQVKKISLSLIMVVAILICACSTDDAISKNWGVNIPEECELIYHVQYPEKTFRGDGVFYYVRTCSTMSLLDKIDETMVWNETDAEFFESICELTKWIPVDKEYQLEQDVGYKYVMLSKNNGNDLLYIIYDEAEARIIIIDSHI